MTSSSGIDLSDFRPLPPPKAPTTPEDVQVEKAIISALISLKLCQNMPAILPALKMAKRALIDQGWNESEASAQIKAVARSMLDRGALLPSDTKASGLYKPCEWSGARFLREFRDEICAAPQAASLRTARSKNSMSTATAKTN